jgi:hypothetical protein
MTNPPTGILDAGHTACVGLTRSGKTTWALERAGEWPGPVIFINTQEENVPTAGDWVFVRGENTVGEITSALLSGFHLNFLPAEDTKQARGQVRVLVDLLFGRVWRPKLLLIADEAYVYAPRSALYTPLHRVARRGLRWGIHGLWISLRPADVSFDLLTQCQRHVIFNTSNYEGSYFRSHGLPGEAIQAAVSAAPPYSYVVWDLREMSGPFGPGLC